MVHADVLLLGCDSKEVGRGLHGVLREWDVLWYFADDRMPYDARMYMDWSGLCASDVFSMEGVRMIRTHIRRRHDITAQRGLYVTLKQ